MPKAKKITDHVALLTPIPEIHLRSAAQVAGNEVSFGSNSFEVFRELEMRAKQNNVPVLVYCSQEGELKHNFDVSWFGWFVRKEEPANSRPTEPLLRPPSAIGERWATFWIMTDLRELPKTKRLPISRISKLSGGKWKAAPVRGPTLIETPEPLSYEALLR